jgi:formylglycine-generating enzyme required for sulfatase activity
MLFDEPTSARIAELWSAVSEAPGAKSNLWDESWDAPLAAFTACYNAAITLQTPEAWRAVAVQGRALRDALEHHDGHEHRLYVASTRVTDAVDKAMDALAKEGRGLVTPEQVERLIAKVQHLEESVADDRASRKLFEVEAKRTLDEVAGKVANAKKALVHLENITLNPKISLISTTLAEIAELITAALQFIENRQLIERIKRAAEKVKEAGADFFRTVRARFAAFRLPWKKSAAEDYLTKPKPPPQGVAFPVRDGGKDRQERRVPGAGVAFQDRWMERGQRMCGPEMVVVPAGEFMMGSPNSEPERGSNEGPQHNVTIPNPFAVGLFAVTVGEYMAGVTDGGCKLPEWLEEGSNYNVKTGSDDHYKKLGDALTGDRHPIVGVSWNDAAAYAAWLSGKTGKTYRLLSEAEWEYVCRAGTDTPFWWGASISTSQANYNGNSTYAGSPKGEYRAKPVPVKSFRPNSWGLYQVHGNVWEWCEDCWNESYEGAPSDGSPWTTGDRASRVLRGGSWDNYPQNLRAAARDRFSTAFRFNSAGFRVARTLNL